MRFLSFVLLFALAACAPSGDPAPAGETSGDVATDEAVDLLTVGGDQSHDFDAWFDAADAALFQEAGIDAAYTDLPADVAAALDTVDVLRLANNQALPGQELRDAIFAHLDEGGGLMIDHAGAWYNWSDWPAYNRELVSGGARGHRAYGPFDVTVVDPGHPVMAGVPESFTIEDELYRFEDDPEGPEIYPLATAADPETGDVFPVVWIVDHPTGRIVVNTLGHDGAAHELPAYRTLVENAARWAAGASIATL